MQKYTFSPISQHFFALHRDDFVHPDVERLGGHFVNHLEVEADADAFHVEVLAEETVVVAASATETVALGVEGHARDDDEVEAALVRLVLWLKDVEVADSESGVLAKFHGDDVVANHGGQDDLFLQVPLVEECLGLHLVGEGTVKHDPVGVDEVGVLLKFGQDLFRLLHQLFLAMLFFEGLDVGAKLFLFHAC